MSKAAQRLQTLTSGSTMPLLLFVLVAALMILPLFEGYGFGRTLIYGGTTAVLAAGAYANRSRRTVFAFSAAIAVVALSLTWSTLVSDHIALFVLSCVLEAVFYGVVACMILASVMRKHMATGQAVFAVISVYLLLGLAWAQLYWATERWEDESLKFPSYMVQARQDPELADFSHVVYFSFVTMSSLGFGDIVPETRITQTLTWMQSVAGQFYLAVLVGWVVSEIPRGSRLASRDEFS
jgi:hypothetical protein